MRTSRRTSTGGNGASDAGAMAKFDSAGGLRAEKLCSDGIVLAGGTSPTACAVMEAQSTTQGFLPPKMTTTQKNAITSPTAGLQVWDTTLGKLCVYNGSAWRTVTDT